MGKIKQKKHKYHSSAPVAMDADSEPEFDTLKQQSTLNDSSLPELGLVQVQNNIFRNIVIPPSVLKQKLPHVSKHSSFNERKARNVETAEPSPLCLELKELLSKQRRLGKKGRLTVREAVAECKKKKEEKVVKLKKKKEAVLGDWKSLKDALSEPEASPASRFPASTKKRRKEREEQMIRDMNYFTSALVFFSWNPKE